MISQACPGLKEGKLSQKTDTSQPVHGNADKSNQIKRYEENKQSDQPDTGDTCGAYTLAEEKAIQDHGDSGPEKKLGSQKAQKNGDEHSKEESLETKNGVDRNNKATPMRNPSQHDPKLQGMYLVREDKSSLLDTDLQACNDDAPPDSEFAVNQQCIAIPSKMSSLSVHCAHVEDSEMKDARHQSESRKRGVKKDLVSKSCPPSLRTASPKISLDQKGPSERNPKPTQRVAISKLRDSSQAGRSRNKDAGLEDAATSEVIQKPIVPADNLVKSQHMQPVQNQPSTDQVDSHIVDLIAKIEQESVEQKQERLARVTDATQKWCSCLPKAHQERIISLGERFLRRMDSTLCFLVVVYRMLAKANWTRSMVAVDIKQAALYAISKGWYVKAGDFRDYPFTREEFAVSAATYLDKIPADAPEDPFRALSIVISHLPVSCARLFSKGQVSCPYCLACCEVSFPSFTSRISWTMSGWTDFATCLDSAEPNPWMHSYGWHTTECNRSDHIPTITTFESWTLIELHLHQPTDFPTLIESQKVTSDPSLVAKNGQVLGFVCTNTRNFNDPNMHYWFIEIENGALRYAFDSLKGLQRLTQDIAKKLIVTGVLLFFGPRKSPVLKSSELDSAAGVIPRVVRMSKPIRVQGRLRANKVRNFLCRQHGVKKRRYKPAKSVRASPPSRGGKSGKIKTHGVGAVTRPALGVTTSARGNGGKKTNPGYRRRQRSTVKSKNVSPAGQIDKLFQLQRKEGLDDPDKGSEQCNVVEDISDEEFEVEKAQQLGRNDIAKNGAVNHSLLRNSSSHAAQGKNAPPTAICADSQKMHLSEDPIEDFSGERTLSSPRQMPGQDLLASPVKNKRNTARTARNHPSPHNIGVSNQTEVKRDALVGQELGTADLILEGLMTENSKKHKSLHKEDASDQCPGGKDNPEVGDQTVIQPEFSGEVPNLGEEIGNPTSHCCSYAAVSLEDTVPAKGIQGQYGIISLFDGVSSVVRILKQKLQQPPAAVILAELDEKIRSLVCAEFGYRADEQWCYTIDGATCCYVRDVHTIIKNDCHLLRQAVAMHPNLKWFIVGGSPCQDLTYAGPSQGLLGLVGSQSRLFFVLLCTIRTMQVLAGTAAVRFLVENAGSMKPVHYVAFCRLLGLPHDPPDRYIWDLAKHTPFISRKRNFFRNFLDFEPVGDIPNFFDQSCGPLLDHKGQVVAFAPLLRTREVHRFGICHSSWTLYQPHALVWDYEFWGGKTAFSSACRLVSGKIPCLCWDRIIPPPFLDVWKKFIHLLQKKGSHARDFDPLIGPLLPIFNCDTFKLPMRLLQETEIMNLSGLGNFWTHTKLQDAEKMPEALIRNMCGNCFHPALIASALGSNETIRQWVDNAQHETHALVAGQHQALATYTELCGLIQKEINKDRKNKKKLEVVQDLPNYPIVEKSRPVKDLPKVAPATICGSRMPEITKIDQRKEHCIEAAILELDQKTCMLFDKYGIGCYFDALRACVRTPFSFSDYCRVTIGDAFDKYSVPVFCAQLPNKPVIRHLQRLQEAFVEWDRAPVMSSLLALLLDATVLKNSSSWAVGHLVLIRKDVEPHLFYVGSAHPKMLLLIDCSQPSHASIVVLGASAYPNPLSVGCVPIVMQSFHEVEALSFSEQLIVEHDRGSWFLHCGRYVTQQGGCIPCFLCKLGVFDFCPWHLTEDHDNRCSGYQVLHLVGKKHTGNEINVLGYIDEFPLKCQLLMFHVCSEEEHLSIQQRICPLEMPFLLPVHGNGGLNLCASDCSTLLSPFQRRNLPHCLSQHFLIRAAGPKSLLNTWLQPRSLI